MRAEILLSTMNSVRQYTAANVRPALARAYAGAGTFVKESIPGFSAPAVFDNFRKDPRYRRFQSKEASLNPTNRANRADEFGGRCCTSTGPGRSAAISRASRSPTRGGSFASRARCRSATPSAWLAGLFVVVTEVVVVLLRKA